MADPIVTMMNGGTKLLSMPADPIATLMNGVAKLLAMPIEELEKLLNDFNVFFKKLQFIPLIHSLIYFFLYFFIGLLITLIVRWFVGKLAERKISRHHSLLLRRITFYIGLTLSILFPLKATGLDVTAFLGAAGIVAGAVAFASQNWISNFLSGIFLEAEKPFVLGDYVNVNDMLGEVLAIDLLSVKIRTKDNVLVRIPNETLLKSQFRNVTRFPIRRFDIRFKVLFNEDLAKLNHVLLETAAKNPLCLQSPPPELTFLEFGDWGIQLMFSVWGKQSSYTTLQTTIQTDMQVALLKAGIELPSPTHVDVLLPNKKM
jgi:small-conductance mechanosensitive channel